MGLSVIALLLAVQNRFPRHYLGIATSATQFFRTIGAAVGRAIMGAVMASRMLSELSAVGLVQQDEQLIYIAQHPDVIVNPLARAQIPAGLLEQAQSALGNVLHDVFLVGFVASLLALASAFLVPPGSAQQHAKRDSCSTSRRPRE